MSATSIWKSIIFRKPVIIGIIGLVISLTLYAMLTVNIPAQGFAVRQVLLGPKKGMQKDILGPGLHLVLPSYERLHLFTRRLQLIELNDNLDSSSALSKYAPSIRIQTSEGYQVTVDVTVAYRIVDPYKVITNIGAGKLYETTLVRPRADRYLRESLGRLNAEDFYNGSRRRAAAQKARNMLEKDLSPNGIQIWDVMVRHYTYDKRYQQAIEQRKIQDQTVYKNKAEGLAAAEEAEKNRVLAEGKAKINIESERGDAEVRKIKAEASLYSRKQYAEGDLLVALAEAEGTKLENNALQAAGAANIVGLEMADVLQGSKVIVIPTDGNNSINPLKLNSLISGW